jgi:hypothetical protein
VNKIFSFVKVSPDSIVASTRIATFISDITGLPITWGSDIADEPLDILVIIGGAYAFAGKETLEALGSAIVSARRVVWVQNDYTIIPPKDESGAESPFRKAFRIRHTSAAAPIDYWTTCQDMSRPGLALSGHRIGPGSSYVNWNALTVQVRQFVPLEERSCADWLVYYGAFRKDRERYFDRYFNAPYIDSLFSCPTAKARERYTNSLVHHETRIVELYAYLTNFGLGLYLEDRLSHQSYHSPANRFYEMLSAGLPIVFQPECRRTFDKAGYDISPFIAWNAEEMTGLLNRRAEILNVQSAWLASVIAENAGLMDQVDAMWREYLR